MLSTSCGTVNKWVYPSEPATPRKVSRGKGIQKAYVIYPRLIKKSTLRLDEGLSIDGCGIVTLSDGKVILSVTQENADTLSGKPQILLNNEPVRKGHSYEIEDGFVLHFRSINGQLPVTEYVFDLQH